MRDNLRVVIDTNHIMSAILSDRGASSKLIGWMTKGGGLSHAADIGTDPEGYEHKTGPYCQGFLVPMQSQGTREGEKDFSSLLQKLPPVFQLIVPNRFQGL